MAQRRLLNRSLGTSRKFAALSKSALADFCQALYPLVMVNADDHGLLQADAFFVKFSVFPVSQHTEDDFEVALYALHEVGLIVLYESDGRRYLQVTNFRTEQRGIKYVGMPTCPLPTQSQLDQRLAGLSEMFRNVPKVSDGVEEKRREENSSGSTSPSGALKDNLEEERSVAETRRSGSRPPAPDPPGFVVFWKSYPLKVKKPKALAAWAKLRCEEITPQVIAGLEIWKQSNQWTKDGGEFIPHPTSWLNGRCWDDQPVAEKTKPDTSWLYTEEEYANARAQLKR